MPEGIEPQPDQASTEGRDAPASAAAPRVVYLTGPQRALLKAIEGRIGDGEFWIASNSDLQDAVEATAGTKPSERTVSRHLSVLRRERVILTSGQPGKPIMIRLTSPARDGEAWVVRSAPDRDGRDVVRDAGRQGANGSRHDSRHLRRHPEMAAAADVDLHGPSLSSDPSSSSDVAAAAADPTGMAADVTPDSRHQLIDVAAADVAAGSTEPSDLAAWAEATNEAVRQAARTRPYPEIVSALRERDVKEPTPELVARIARLRPDEAAFFWRQMDAWGIGKPWAYAMACVDTAIGECNLEVTLPPDGSAAPAAEISTGTPEATTPTSSPPAQEASGTPPRRLLGRLTRAARAAALDAIRGIEERIGDGR